jgi:hypothetical protein
LGDVDLEWCGDGVDAVLHVEFVLKDCLSVNNFQVSGVNFEAECSMCVVLVENCGFEFSDCFLVEPNLVDNWFSLVLKLRLLVSEDVKEVLKHLER